MPKKTREEKMAAQLRRMKEQLSMRQTAPVAAAPPKPSQEEKPPEPASTKFSVGNLEIKSPTASQPAKEAVQRYDYAYLVADLRKIAALATAAVALEIVLNLTTRASFAKLILRSFGIDI